METKGKGPIPQGTKRADFTDGAVLVTSLALALLLSQTSFSLPVTSKEASIRLTCATSKILAHMKLTFRVLNINQSLGSLRLPFESQLSFPSEGCCWQGAI